jgi:pimeloyl-ACP methyl ester carboxylesterase
MHHEREYVSPRQAALAYEPKRGWSGWAIGAAAMAATAFLVHRQAKAAERARPPKGGFLTVDGVRLHYHDRGEGPAVVFLHGNGTLADDFLISGVYGEATHKYRVLAFDRPGFGYSERPRRKVWTAEAQAALLLNALRQLGVGEAIIVAHSFATQVAIAMALAAPSRVRALVLEGGYYFPTPRLDALLLSWPAVPVIGDVLRYTASALLSRLMLPRIIRRIFQPAAVPPRFRHMPTELMLRPSQLRAAAEESALLVPQAMRLQKRYRALRMPVFLLAGADDKIVSARSQTLRLFRTLERGEIRILPRVGHMAHHTAPKALLTLIDDAATAADIQSPLLLRREDRVQEPAVGGGDTADKTASLQAWTQTSSV